MTNDLSRERITLAIPFYKGTEYLKLALESVLRQSNPNWQVVVSDDRGSNADIQALVSAYNDPRIRYSRNEQNLGMAANWNRCLELARTDLVTLFHADDELLPNYVDVMLHAAKSYPIGSAYFCQATVIDENGNACFSIVDYLKRFLIPSNKSVVFVKGQRGLERLMRGNFIMCPTVCYRKSQLCELRFSDKWKMVHDLDLYCKLLFAGGTLVGLPERAYAYRRHPENATSLYTMNLLRFEEEIALLDLVATEARARSWTRAARVAQRKEVILLHLLYRTLEDGLRGRWKSSLGKLRMLFQTIAGC